MKQYKVLLFLIAVVTICMCAWASPVLASHWHAQVGVYNTTVYATSGTGGESDCWILGNTTVSRDSGSGPAQLRMRWTWTGYEWLNDYSSTRTIPAGETVNFRDWKGGLFPKGHSNQYLRRGSSDSWHVIW